MKKLNIAIISTFSLFSAACVASQEQSEQVLLNSYLYPESFEKTKQHAFECVKAGNTAALSKIVQQYPKMVGEADRLENTLLHYAASLNDYNTVVVLLNHHAYVDAQNRVGHTPLHKAAKRSFADIVKLLLERGASVAITTERGLTALHMAVTGCVAQLLIDHGADIHKPDKSGEHPIHAAAFAGCSPVVQTLLDAGADANALATGHITPLHCASDPDVTTLLIGAGALVNVQNVHGMTPLHLAAFRSLETVVRALLRAGARVNVQDAGRTTPLHLAQSSEAAEMLINYGAEIEARNAVGYTPLILAAMHGCTAAVKALLHHGANVDARNAQGYTALHCAAHPEIAKLLLGKGAHPRDGWLNHNTLTPLHTARNAQVLHTLTNQFDTTSRLLSFLLRGNLGAALRNVINIICHSDIDTVHHTRSPLVYAIIHDREDVVKALIDMGATVTAQDRLGATPLHFGRSRAVIQLLVTAGADINRRTNNGKTPLIVAVCRGAVDAVRALADFGATNDRTILQIYYLCKPSRWQLCIHNSIATESNY